MKPTCVLMIGIALATWPSRQGRADDVGLRPPANGTISNSAAVEFLAPADAKSFDNSATIPWTSDQASDWAYRNSPTAALVEMERRAVAKLLDCDDEEQRAMAGLIQAVSAELALHRRHESAANALVAYYQIVAAREQIELLNETAPLIKTLQALAKTAEQLELVDGDRDALADQRLQLEDKWFEIDFGAQRLRNQIAGLAGRPFDATERLDFVSPLPLDVSLQADEAALVEIALATRHDLKATEALCRCLNEKSLPAARDLLGTLVPGLGLDALLGVSGGGLLKLHHRRDKEAADLAERRAQCRKLAENQRDMIRREVRDALLGYQAAEARLDVANRRVEAQRNVADRTRRGQELEQLPPGSEEQANLETLRLKTLRLQRRLAYAEALVQIQRVTGRRDLINTP